MSSKELGNIIEAYSNSLEVEFDEEGKIYKFGII